MAKETINTYQLMRRFLNYAFEHPECKCQHIAIFTWIIDLNNRLGWKQEFGLPTADTMEGLSIGNKRTYLNALRELRDWGFIIIIKEAKNQYQSCIIKICRGKSEPAQVTAYDVAIANMVYQNSSGIDTGIGLSTDTGTVHGTAPIDIHQTSNIKHIVVVEYARAKDFFLQSRNHRVLQETHKIDSFKIDNFFKRFYDEKIDIGELNNKTESDLIKHFTMWLPKIIFAEKNNSIKNNSERGIMAVQSNMANVPRRK